MQFLTPAAFLLAPLTIRTIIAAPKVPVHTADVPIDQVCVQSEFQGETESKSYFDFVQADGSEISGPSVAHFVDAALVGPADIPSCAVLEYDCKSTTRSVSHR
jgi:hypothetical protein